MFWGFGVVRAKLTFTLQDICIIFTVKVVFSMKIVKVANVTKIYGGNPIQGYAKFNTEIG